MLGAGALQSGSTERQSRTHAISRLPCTPRDGRTQSLCEGKHVEWTLMDMQQEGKQMGRKRII